MSYDVLKKSRQLARIASSLRKNFDLWSYTELFLPAITEYDESLDKGTKFTMGDQFYVIKPDITSQIRTKLDEIKQRKFYYFSEVLTGDVRGDWQFGVEYIGGKKTWMTVEILSAIITALERLGIMDFYIDMGSRKVWQQVTRELGNKREKVFEALYHRNFELIDEIQMAPEKKEEIWELFNFRGKETDYERINSILEAVDDERLFADFGTVRHRPYYEDITFEIYSPQVGAPLGGGGEYKFQEADSCGFAFNIEFLSAIFPDEDGNGATAIEDDLIPSYNRARELVTSNKRVEVQQCK